MNKKSKKIIGKKRIDFCTSILSLTILTKVLYKFSKAKTCNLEIKFLLTFV